MKIIWWIGFVALFLLSASTGVVKLVTIAFGALQLGAALALILDRTRRAAAVVLAGSYIAATGIVFANGMLVFGVSSLTFIALAAVFAKWPDRPRAAT